MVLSLCWHETDVNPNPNPNPVGRGGDCTWLTTCRCSCCMLGLAWKPKRNDASPAAASRAASSRPCVTSPAAAAVALCGEDTRLLLPRVHSRYTRNTAVWVSLACECRRYPHRGLAKRIELAPPASESSCTQASSLLPRSRPVQLARVRVSQRALHARGCVQCGRERGGARVALTVASICSSRGTWVRFRHVMSSSAGSRASTRRWCLAFANLSWSTTTRSSLNSTVCVRVEGWG